MLCSKRIIRCIQFLLLFLNHFIREVLKLIFNQLIDNSTKLHHTDYTLFCLVVQIHSTHNRIFSKINFPIYNRIGEVLNIRISRNYIFLRSFFCFTKFYRLVFPANMSNSFLEQLCQIYIRERANSKVILAILRTFHSKLTQNHFRMIYKITVHGMSFFCAVQMHPIRNNVNGMITLLKKNNIRNHLRPRILLKCVIRQSDSPKKFCSLCQIFTGICVFGIHGIAAGYKSNYTSRSYLIQRFGKEIIVD